MPSVPSFYPSTDNLPHGIDRADGLSGRLGTPTPVAAIKYESPNGGVTVDQIPINELSSSPSMERAEQCTIRKSFTGPYAEMLNRWAVYPRGTLVVDSGANYYRILNTNLQHMASKGEVGQLDLTMEALSFDSPPDEFNCMTVNLGLDIMKNPRYFYAIYPTAQIPTPWPAGLSPDTAIQSAVKSTIVRAIQAYKENPLVPPQQVLNNTSGFYHDLMMTNMVAGTQIYAVPNPNFKPQFTATAAPKVGTHFPEPSGNLYPDAATAQGQPNPPVYYTYFKLGESSDPYNKVAMAMAAAQELLTKIWRMEDSPPVYGFELTHSQYYWRPPYINLGSYIEDPQAATPPVPDYFLCPAVIPNGSTIFDAIGNFNPQYYSQNGEFGGGASISWLRQADSLEFNRTFFKLTRKWLGAPYGAWDADLFNQKRRPQVPDDYKRIILS